VLAILGLLRIRPLEISALLLFPALTITFVNTLFFARPRFDYPAEPFLILSAVVAVFHFSRSYNSRAHLQHRKGQA
jgi:hypothetical protein